MAGEQAGKYPQILPDNEHCSAFIATGSWTGDGQVVMARNSWTWFDQGQYYNVVTDLEPAAGHRILMQSAPGFIDSATDYFTTDAGLMGHRGHHPGGYSRPLARARKPSSSADRRRPMRVRGRPRFSASLS